MTFVPGSGRQRASLSGNTACLISSDLLTIVVLSKVIIGFEIVQKALIEGNSVSEGAISGLLKSSDPAVLQLAKMLAKPSSGKGTPFWNGVALMAAAVIQLTRDKAASSAAKVATGQKRGVPDNQGVKKRALVDATPFSLDQIEMMAIRRRIF